MSLLEQLKGIREEMLRRVTAHVNVPVIIGRKADANKFKPPLVWILPETASIGGQGKRAIHEDWYPIYWIIGVSMDKDPDVAREEAEELAVKASAGLLLDPDTLQVDQTLGDRVHYIERVGWAPGDTRLITNETLHGAGLQIRMRFETEEVE